MRVGLGGSAVSSCDLHPHLGSAPIFSVPVREVKGVPDANAAYMAMLCLS